jgi:predicted nucleic acid-binding protein
MILVDADILIDSMRQQDQAWSFLRQQPITEITLHAVVSAEIVVGARDLGELRLIDRFLGQFALVVPTEADFLDALALLRKHRLSAGIGWADCLIAATALRCQATIATRNDKHFRAVAGLALIRPY